MEKNKYAFVGTVVTFMFLWFGPTALYGINPTLSLKVYSFFTFFSREVAGKYVGEIFSLIYIPFEFMVYSIVVGYLFERFMLRNDSQKI